MESQEGKILKIEKGIDTAGKIDLYYEHYQHDKARETIVLLHGFLSSAFCFRSLIPLLKQDYNVLALDLPPFGKSGKNSRYLYSYSSIANTAAGFLERRGLSDVILAGHSMGGQICLYMERQCPGRFRSIILLAGSGYLPAAPAKYRRLTYLPFFPLAVKHYLGKTGIEGSLKNVVYNRELIDEDMRNGYGEPFMGKNHIFRALGKMLRDREGDLPEEELRKVKAHCLLIWGRHDRVVPLSIGERLSRDLPNARLCVLEDAGHLLPEEKPEEVSRLIRDFAGTAKERFQ